MIDQAPRSQRYRDLCHVVVMSKTGNFEASLDGLVSAILTQDNRPGGLTATQVRLEVHRTFGINLDKTLISGALERCAGRREVIHIRATDTYAVEPATKHKMVVALADARALEASVRAEWLASLDPPVELTSAVAQELWAMILEYAARAFRRHGAEMQLLINPDPVTTPLGSNLSGILKSAIEETCHVADHEVAMHAAYQFFTTLGPERARYITSLLDATFTIYALGADKGLAEYMHGLTRPISLFVDTNFIFAILGLHENALVEVSKELVDLVTAKHLPIRLIVHRDTMREFQFLVGLARQALGGRHWSQAVSSALLQTDDLGAIERRFHEENGRHPTDVDAFFLQFSERAVLGAMNAPLFRRKADRDAQEIVQVHELEGEFAEFVKARGRDRTSYAVAHDISVLTDVARLQRRGASVMGIRALFLTTDYSLFDFDWSRFRAPGSVGTAVLPSQFLQLVRPFIPVSDDFDSRFVKTFALPEVRIVNTDRSRVIGMLGSLLNAMPGIDEPLAVRIITDEALVGRLLQLTTEPDAFAKLVTETIALENQALAIERDVAQNEARRIAVQLDEATKREVELRNAIEKGTNATQPAMGDRHEPIASSNVVTDQVGAQTRKRKWLGWGLVEHPRAATFIACLGTSASVIGGVVAKAAGVATLVVAAVIVVGTVVSLGAAWLARARSWKVALHWPVTVNRRP